MLNCKKKYVIFHVEVQNEDVDFDRYSGLTNMLCIQCAVEGLFSCSFLFAFHVRFVK